MLPPSVLWAFVLTKVTADVRLSHKATAEPIQIISIPKFLVPAPFIRTIKYGRYRSIPSPLQIRLQISLVLSLFLDVLFCCNVLRNEERKASRRQLIFSPRRFIQSSDIETSKLKTSTIGPPIESQIVQTHRAP